MVAIKEKIVRKFNRKTKEYDRVVSVFAKYKVYEKIGEPGSPYCAFIVEGPKEKFILAECSKPLKVYRPNQPVKELRLFFVNKFKTLGLTKIQGAAYFALDGELLIPYKACGRGSVKEL